MPAAAVVLSRPFGQAQTRSQAVKHGQLFATADAKTPRMLLVCTLCVGASHEPHLELTLASIAPVVDLLVINDNSSLARSSNVETLERSAFGREGRLRIHRHPFTDFATMRNDVFGHVRAMDATPDWMMWLDADEVHGSQVVRIKALLPRLGRQIGHVDAYTYHFTGNYRWITDTARRFAFYRYDPQLRWRNAVHEKIEGLRGGAIVLPYVYHHYGSVLDPVMYAARYRRYVALAPHAYDPPLPGQETLENTLAHDRERARPFRGSHPGVARAFIAVRESRDAELFAQVDRLFAKRKPADRIRNLLADAGEAWRVRSRRLQHPLLYREPVSAL